MKNRMRRGSALILVLVAAVFLIILSGALYTYLTNSTDTQVWTRERIQAKLTAEAGINLATHMLVAGAELPTIVTPQPMLGMPGSYETLPGELGEVYVTVDPNDSNTVVTNANAFMLRCISRIPGAEADETYGMQAIVMPENLARFSVFMDDPSLDGAYVDGYRFDGPFYANGPVRVISNSPTHENDPFFYSFTLTSDYYISDWGTTQATGPASGNLEMRPFNRLSMGEPYFQLGVDPIPFGPDELDWEGVRNAAISDGLLLPAVEDGARIVLRDSTLVLRRTPGGANEVFDLASLGNPVVWVENNATDRIYLKGNDLHGFDMSLTMGMTGHLYLSGNLMYANRDLEDLDNDNLLGLLTVYGDILIADDFEPPDSAEVGWDGFQIVTHDDFEVDAVLVALDGVLKAEDHTQPAGGPYEFLLLGGYMIQEEGYTSSWEAGFDISVYFDPRLLSKHPPFFPTTANWIDIMWEDRPDMDERDVEIGIPTY